jgi:N-acetylmuramoyl-L-alanine amidase
MRTNRVLNLMAATVVIVTGLVAVMLIVLPAQTDATAQSPNVVAETTTALPPTTVPPTTVAPPATEVPPAAEGSLPEPVPVPEPESETGTLRSGDRGPEVLALQQRLSRLGYWLGTPDGTYGDLTVQAVVAFQKVEGMDRDGIAGAGTTAALDTATRPTASGAGDLVEVDKDRQVLFVVRGGDVEWVLNTSTGTEQAYAINGRKELADTPPGHWEVSRAEDGVDVGELGSLYRPRYFHPDGIAVHGYFEVPAYPASHGCVRVSNAAIDWIWAENLMPIGSSVWVY